MNTGERPEERLRSIFDEASVIGNPDRLRHQLAYRHMIHLADVFEGWAIAEHISPRDTARLTGWAGALRKLAEEVGENWDPPAPANLSLMGFLARRLLGEA